MVMFSNMGYLMNICREFSLFIQESIGVALVYHTAECFSASKHELKS